MKTRLSKNLLAILFVTFTTTAQAGYFSPATSTEEGEMVLGTATDTGYTIDAKDGATEATITGTVDSTSALYVREGKLTVGGTTTHNTVTLMPNTGGQLEGTECGPTILAVSGNNAEMVIDNATVTSSREASSSIGGADGNGTLTIQNGGKYLGGNKVSFFVGYKSYDLEGETPNQVNVHATTQGLTGTETGDTTNLSNRYQGTYTEGLNGTKFGKGTVTVSGQNSELVTGYGGFYMAEGVVTVEDNAKMTTGTYAAQLAVQTGSTSVLNVKNNAEATFRGQLHTGCASATQSSVNVNDATLSFTHAFFGLGSYNGEAYVSNGSTTTVNFTGESTIKANGITVAYNDKTDLFVGAGTTVKGHGEETPNMYVYELGTVTNQGSIQMNVDLDGGTFIAGNDSEMLELVATGGQFVVDGSIAVMGDISLGNTEFVFADGSIIDLNGGNFTLGENCSIKVVMTEAQTMLLSDSANSEYELKGITFNNAGSVTGLDGDITITLVESLEDENGTEVVLTADKVIVNAIPEPTTATLSLLALATLAARRRRR